MSVLAQSLDGSADHAVELREQLSNVQGLLMLSMLMTESTDQDRILELATTSLPSFAPCRSVGVRLGERWWRDAVVPSEVDDQLAGLARGGGPITVPGAAWAMALRLRGLGATCGCLVVAGDEEPSAAAQFLLRVLAQQTGVAVGNARLHARERAAVADLRATNATLADTVRALEQTTRTHDRFTRVAVAGEGQEGIARALHELTGYRVAIEDRWGNLRAWAGPNQPEPYPKDPPARREQLLRRALRECRPIREGGRLLAVAQPGADALGVLALIDPGRTAGEPEQMALEHAATVLAMELARLRSLAETELRLRRDLVEELLAGTDEDSALARAQALGHDLECPHRVLVIEGRGRTRDEDAFFHAVRRSARSAGVGALLVARAGSAVLLSAADLAWDGFRVSVLTELGGGHCRIGIGTWCDGPADVPRSYREAQLALKMQRASGADDRVSRYDELGVYQILSEIEDPVPVERFIQRWLGALLAYDERKKSELVTTLSQYLECGGGYDATAAALSVHRSTLKYRLQRIREISGHDITEPDTHFNLQLATRAWRTLATLRS